MHTISRLKAILDLVSTTIVIVAAGVLIHTLTVRQSKAAPPAAERVTGLRIETTRVRNVLGHGPIAIVEFSDFQCPYCRKFAREMWPAIKTSLVDTGKARYVAFSYPLEMIHPLALGASEAAECAARQDRFWDMRESLFDEGDALTPPDLIGHATRLNLTRPNDFQKCLVEHDMLQAVRASQDEGRRLGVTGTPTFFTGIVQPDGAIQLAARIRGGVDANLLSEQIAALSSSLAAGLRE